MKLFKTKRKRPEVVEIATKRRLHVSHLELGLYICELHRPLRQTGFLFQGFPLLKLEHIHAVRERCDYVFVDDTRRVLIDQGQMIVPTATPLRVTRKMTRIPLSLEVQEAREAYLSSSLVLEQVLLDVQQVRAIDTKACQAVGKPTLQRILRTESSTPLLTLLHSQKH